MPNIAAAGRPRCGRGAAVVRRPALPSTLVGQLRFAAEHGKQVYADAKCAVCHSIGSQGNKKGPLDDVGSKLSTADIRAWIMAAPEMATKTKADRKPPMKAYTDLSKTDVDDLVAYLQTLKKK